jgi:hypothetical protein
MLLKTDYIIDLNKVRKPSTIENIFELLRTFPQNYLNDFNPCSAEAAFGFVCARKKGATLKFPRQNRIQLCMLYKLLRRMLFWQIGAASSKLNIHF